MAFDAVAVRCLVKDLKDKLINSRIDKIHQPEKDEITINLRTMTDNFKLVLSASPAHPRVHFTNVSKKNPISAPMFCMLLRKHIGSGKITDIEQIGFERIIKFSIESYDELGDLKTKYLIVEIMGRHSNIILTNQDMRILDCIKHIDFTVSSVRQLLPGLDYVSPPVQDKTDLTEISETANIDFSSPIQTADKAILSAIAGISPLTSREIVYRAFGRTDVKCSELTDNGRNKLLYETVKLAKDVQQNNFSPCMIINSASGKLMEFSATPITQYESLAEIKEFDDISVLLDTFYRTRDMHERMRQKSADLVKLLNNNIERVSKKLGILNKTLADSENKDKYKKTRGGIVVKGIHDVAVRFSKCCNPVPGDEIVGFVTRGRGVTIHRTDCVNVINFPENERERLIEAEWEQVDSSADKYSTEINIFAGNRTGLIVDISRIFTEANIDVKFMNSRVNKKGIATINLGFDIHGKDELNRLVEKLRNIEGVTDIARTAG